jgi:hypothetical protein
MHFKAEASEKTLAILKMHQAKKRSAIRDTLKTIEAKVRLDAEIDKED